MTKVKVDTPGVTVEVEADDSLDVVSAKVMELFHAAGGWPQDRSTGSVGFTSEKTYFPRPYVGTMDVPPTDLRSRLRAS